LISGVSVERLKVGADPDQRSEIARSVSGV
jgi:hypothetical protein